METYVPHDFRPKDLEDLTADEMEARESKKKRREDLKAQREAAAARKKWEEENPDIVAEVMCVTCGQTACISCFRKVRKEGPACCPMVNAVV